ncbi:MAG: hypothetical protein J2P52_13530 [Blastocatellia bacterium]|nr:hypothetical protein [Blastocatellia bacterium]
MKKINRRYALIFITFVVGIAATCALHAWGVAGKEQDLIGRIVAVGIPGVSAISPVGTFLPGGPIHDNPAFAAYTQPGRILDPARILVGSRSNFGAALPNSDEMNGSFLSIDPLGAEILVIPSDFASAGGQASTLGGRVQMYSSNSSPFLNGVNNPLAVTANFTGVSNPLGLSINNAFGRLWPANAPAGLDGAGTSTILDPTGLPLAGAPNPQAGGVFAGDLTPRLPAQVIPGALDRGAVGTAFLGRSPDGSGRAVFCVVLADGGIIQAHTGEAVDGLAPIGAVSPLLDCGWDDEDDDTRLVQPRLGVILNYTRTRILYVSEPFRNTIAVIDLIDDGVIFRVGAIRRIHSEALNGPIDLAPADIETEAPDWASNTTLEEGADFYVANRRDNTIVRMRQDGTVVAVRRVRLANGRSLGNARLNGIATSPDGSKIWVTVTGHLPGQGNLSGAVIELPAFAE